MASWITDGQEIVSGVSGSNPVAIPRNYCASAINRWFRYDENAPRCPFRELKLTYIDDTDGNNKKLLEAGNVQGAEFYTSYPTFGTSYIVLSVAGTIFTVQIIGDNGYVRKLFTGNDPVFTHAWFGQAFQWMVIQDGSAKPILWDGVNPARRAVDGEVPTGSIMEFIHGRLAVASADGTNQIAIGDIVYGNDVTTTTDVIKFTEIEYWAEGGAFGAPVYVGDLMGMKAMPYLDTGTGQNELVVIGTNGAISIDLSGPRLSWIDGRILRISLVGGGCVSSHSLATMNGELFFRSSEGVRAFKNARGEFQQSWKQTPISTDVRRWIADDSQELLQYNSQTSWNNLLLSTCQPRTAPPNNAFAGHHRFHLGFVVMDASPESNTLRDGAAVWQGVWTGIRPICFVTGRVKNNNRSFAISHDCDGRNRIYELRPDDFGDTVKNEKVKIRSSYDTGSLGIIERVANNFTLKKLGGGSITLSDVRDETKVTIKQRPDGSPCFLEMDNFTVGCDCKVGDCSESFTLPTYATKHFASKEQCVPGSTQLSNSLYSTQVRIELDGWAKVDRMRVKFSRQEDADAKDCDVQGCKPVQCCDDEFYCIAEGEGPPVPFIEIPSDVGQFEATATMTVSCPVGTFGESVTKTATATSTVSYEDAYIRAQSAALVQATAALDCTTCDTFTIYAFVSNNEDTDLSDFFQGYPASMFGRPWRLIEIVTGIVYASGIVVASGELLVVYAIPPGVTYLDETTLVFVDGGVTDAYMALEMGCNQGGIETWPETPSYFSA